MRRLAVVAVAVVAVVFVSGCEPSMTITARNEAGQSQYCGTVMHVIGVVNPATATPKVVLQQTKSGKWVDSKGFGSKEQAVQFEPGTLRTGAVNKTTGHYRVNYYFDPSGTFGDFVMHLRVRSNGGGSVSPGFYVSAAHDGYC